MKELKNIILTFFCLGIFACGSSEETKAWEAAKVQASEDAIDAFLAKYPESGYQEEAKKYKEHLLWEYALLENTCYHFLEYKSQYPEGKYVAQAQNIIDSLQKEYTINLAQLTQNRFTGYIQHDKQDLEILSLRFVQIQESADEVLFVADVTLSSNLRKNLQGRIDLARAIIYFEEDTTDDFLAQLGRGAVYIRGNQILIESIVLGSYWKLKNI